MRVLITGATGLLGRNLLFEIIKQNVNKLDELHIFVLGRSSKNIPIDDRITHIISTDGADYLSLPNNEIDIPYLIKKCFTFIPFDLTQNNLSISEDHLSLLRKQEFDYFFHLAALSEFRINTIVKQKLDQINNHGTNRILNLINQLRVNEVIYTGTAYSCGLSYGVIEPNNINLNGQFRNYYEESKLTAEINLQSTLSQRHIRYRIFRAVGFCGRLIEKQIGSTCKYDLFYAWAAFFLKQKFKIRGSIAGIYDTNEDMPVRILCNQHAPLNVVPADYAAKLIYSVCVFNDPGTHYHLANDVEIPHRECLSLILDELKITGYNFVEIEPNNMNDLEILYYKTVGSIYTPYLLYDGVYFNTKNLLTIKNRANLTCPPMNKSNLKKLINYAKTTYFGISQGLRSTDNKEKVSLISIENNGG